MPRCCSALCQPHIRALAMQTLWDLHVLLCPDARIAAHLAVVAAQKLRDACIAERGGWRSCTCTPW